MGKSTISMTIFNSYVCLPEGIYRSEPESHQFSNIPLQAAAGRSGECQQCRVLAMSWVGEVNFRGNLGISNKKIEVTLW